MKGPVPKDPKLRQKKGKAATRKELTAEASEMAVRPPLPPHPEGDDWHPMAEIWWDNVWSSPMHYEYLLADSAAVFRMLVLTQAFWTSSAITTRLSVSAELRRLETEFGLTPLSRRRLEWSVAQSEEAKAKQEKRRASRSLPIGADPRGALE